MKLNLNLSNDFLFRHVMEQNPELLKEFVELIIERKLGKITAIYNEKYLDVSFEGKNVRLDVFFKTDDGIGVNLEMQNQKVFPEKRARYYQSIIDYMIAKEGAEYDELPDSYLIVICTFDPFGKGNYKYTVSKYVEENANIKINDGQHLIYLNTKGRKGNISLELINALKMIENTNKENLKENNTKMAKKLYKAKEAIMENENKRKVLIGSLMPLEMHISALKKAVKIEAYNEGISEGKNKGRKEEQEKIIKTMRSKGFSDDEIKDYTGLDVKKK